jgi:hypothetical protein
VAWLSLARSCAAMVTTPVAFHLAIATARPGHASAAQPTDRSATSLRSLMVRDPVISSARRTAGHAAAIVMVSCSVIGMRPVPFVVLFVAGGSGPARNATHRTN